MSVYCSFSWTQFYKVIYTVIPSIIHPDLKKWMLAVKVFGEITWCWISIL